MPIHWNNQPQKVCSGHYQEPDMGWGWQRVILLIIILQSIGIRAIPMQSTLSSVLIFLVLVPRIGISIQRFICFICLCVIYNLLAIRGMSTYSGIIYQTSIMFTSLLFVQYVENRWKEVEFDLLQITWWLSLHGLVSYLVYKIEPAFFPTFEVGQLRYKVLGFFVLSGWEPIRATGLCWEPGLLQYLANISLFLGIKHSWPRWKLAVSFFTVVVTYSTAGIFVLTPVMIYLLLVRRRSFLQWVSIAATAVIVCALGMTIFQENITDKLSGKNVSGLVRLRDMTVGLELIQDRPFLGHGLFDAKYLSSQSKVWEIENTLFSKVYLSEVGDMFGGYTNGFMGILAGYGLFIGTGIYWCFYNNQLIQGGIKERLTFFFISIATFISEPITNTSWFLVLTLSGLLINKRQISEFKKQLDV